MSSIYESFLLSRLDALERTYITTLKAQIDAELATPGNERGMDYQLPVTPSPIALETIGQLYGLEGWKIQVGRRSGQVLRLRPRTVRACA